MELSKKLGIILGVTFLLIGVVGYLSWQNSGGTVNDWIGDAIYNLYYIEYILVISGIVTLIVVFLSK